MPCCTYLNQHDKNQKLHNVSTQLHTSDSLRSRIAELEEELARTKRMARCPHDPKPGIGGVIQRLRQREEISINQLADASGVSKGQISRLERADDPNVEIHTLRKLVISLGSSLSEVFATVEAKEPPRDLVEIANRERMEAIEQSLRDARRADKNAAEIGRLRAVISEAIAEARTLEANTDSLVDGILAPALLSE